MGNAQYIGRVGALAVVLGIGAAVANTPGVAWALPATDGSGTDAPSTTGTGSTTTGTTTGTTPSTTTGSTTSTTSTGSTTASGSATTGSTGGQGTPPAGASDTDDSKSTRVKSRGGAQSKAKLTAPALGLGGDNQKSTYSSPDAGAKPSSRLSTGATSDVGSPPNTAAALQSVRPFRALPRNLVATVLGGASASTSETTLATQSQQRTLTTDTAATQTSAGQVDAKAGTSTVKSPPANLLTTAVSGVLAWAGLTPNADANPTTPVESPTLWALLAWARRQTGQTITTQASPTTPDATLNSQSTGTQSARSFSTLATAAVVNTAPTASPTQTAPNQTTGAITGSINGADAEGNTLTYSVAGTPPASGAVAVNATTGAFTYTPTQAARLAAGQTAAADFDSFTVSVSDGQTPTSVTVSVPVLPAVVSSTTTKQVGSNPMGVAVSPTKTYVANLGSNTVSVIDRTSGAVTTISVVATPTAIALSPDGTRAYVAGNNGVSVINTATNTVVGSYTTGGGQAYSITVAPNGQRVYVAMAGTNKVAVLNTTSTTPTLVATVAVGSIPAGIAVSADGTRVYVTNYGSNTMSVINTATNTVIKTISPGANPEGVAVSPDGTRVYVANLGSNNVTVINPTATTTTVATVAVGTNPLGLAISPDGSVVYTANGNDTVSLINTKTNAVITTVTIDTAPENNWHGIGISPDGNQIYVGDMADASVRSFTLNRGNTAPIAGTPTVGSPSGTNGAVTGTLNFRDVDGDTLTYSVPSQPSSGNVVVTAAGGFTYTPTTAARNAAALT
ncbi:MAG: hypothetical protein QOH57_2738, partial [Mycobacterium sp.]|nr:hypothetical protein [Mycobacterium sp.]